MRLADLDDPLPEELIAQEPAPERSTASFSAPAASLLSAARLPAEAAEE
jgi:S-adenosylmethionine:tRNA-ribosyltransferase-isomerase (queuine synthetase)